MTCWRDSEDDADDLDDREEPDDSDVDDSDEPDLSECPYCRKSISEDAERCHHCGNYIVDEDVLRRRVPLWLIAGVALVGVVILIWIVR